MVLLGGLYWWKRSDRSPRGVRVVPVLAGIIPDERLVSPSVGTSGSILNPEGAFFVVEVVMFAVKDPRPL